MIKVSERVARLEPSATLAMSQKSAEMKAQGIDVINLSVGEPDFHTPDYIKTAAHTAIDDNYSYYSPVAGYGDLRKAIANKLLRENGLSYSAEEITVSNGAKQCVSNAILALVNDGDEVLIPAPYWVSYPQMVLLAGGVPIVLPTTLEGHFKITPAQLAAALTPRTRLLILCSPSNPSGCVYSKEELRALAAVLRQHDDILVLSDEIYEHINYTGCHASIAQVDGMKEHTIVVNGVSKAFAMTGWRIGFMAADKRIVKACNKLQGQTTSGPSSISQRAAMEAYSNTEQTAVEDMRQEFERRRDLMVALLQGISGFEVVVPDGAFYIFPRCNHFFGMSDGQRTINNSSDFALYLLEEGHVATVAGSAFGDDSCFRMSYATSEDNIREALRRIAVAVGRLH